MQISIFSWFLISLQFILYIQEDTKRKNLKYPQQQQKKPNKA